ncbi:MAG TPA: hypothetical protein VG937_30365 [Polyangiaceae bacterium]|nr:hypothetical protein [Polyangiaceae bacterium]
MTGSPRCHHYQFAHAALRSVAFAHPLRLMALLASPGAKEAFESLLEQVNETCKDCGEPADFNAEQLQIHHRRAAGHPCAVVVMPPPRATGEAHYAAPVLLMHGTPENVELRYFTLEYSTAYEAGPSTVLGEWQADGTHVNHGPGPAPDVEAFLEAIAGRLRA